METYCSFVQEVNKKLIFCEKCGKPLSGVINLVKAVQIQRRCSSLSTSKDCDCVVDMSMPDLYVRSLPINIGVGAGFVIPGGGPYLKSAWVTIRMLREFGRQESIEVWLLPWETIDENTRRVFSFFNAEFRTANSGFCLDETINAKKWKRDVWLAGWQLKVQAVLQSRFNQVIYLDADCYPIDHEAINRLIVNDNTFLHDIPESDSLLPESTLALFSVKNEPVDSGAFYVKKSQKWCEFVAALNGPENVKHVYGDLLWGDKDTWQLAMVLSGEKCNVIGPAIPAPNVSAIIHGAGFVHRTGCKFTDEPLKNTPQMKAVSLPGDALTERFLRSWPLMQMRVDRDFHLAEGPLELDEYRLRIHPLPKFAVDGGGHIGGFSRSLKNLRPDVNIIAIEPDKENASLFEQNVGVKPICCALGMKPGTKSLVPLNYGDTCYKTVEGGDITVFPLSVILDAAKWEQVDLLKLDIEGDELEVIVDLIQTDWIFNIKRIVGEYHTQELAFKLIKLLSVTHDCIFCFHSWQHGYFEATRNKT